MLIWKACMLAGFRVTGDPRARFDHAVYWHDVLVRAPDAEVERLAAAGTVWNAGVRDISKRVVDRAVATAFGFPTLVDPTTYSGPCVEKSDDNAKRDGRIVTCPIPPAQVRPDKVYQVYNGTVPCVFLKKRPAADRFGKIIVTAAMSPAADGLSPDELRGILAVCRALGVDYAEVDTVRDNASGRLYVLDVNPTPLGPTSHMPRRLARAAVAHQARALAAALPSYRSDAAERRAG